MKTSRNTPPPAPVMVPIMIAAQKGKCSPEGIVVLKVFSTPVTVKRARPMVSKINQVLFCLTSNFLKTITHSKAKADDRR